MVQEQKKSNTLLIVVLVVVGFLIVGGLVGAWVFKKIASEVVETVIEKKTGLNIDSDSKSLTFTDKTTGQTINVGAEQKLPDDFPSDFPIYPGSKPTGSLSGDNKTEQTKGFWVVLTTGDDVSKVANFYKENLPKNGYEVENAMTLNEMTTYAVKKGQLSGAVAVTVSEDKAGSSIVITLGTSQ